MSWQDDPVVGESAGPAAGAPAWASDPVVGEAPAAKPAAIGKDANERFLREELKNADWFTRNLAGAGVSASDTWESFKQLFGQGDRERIEANKVIAEEAPVGKVAGDLAMLAGPMAAAGASVKGAAAVGGAFGATRPTEADPWSVAGLGERLKNTAVDAALSGGGQAVVNAGGKYVAGKLAENATRKAQNAPRDTTLSDAIDRGFVAPPSSVDPSLWNVTKESFGGKIATAQAASNKNAPLFESAARADLGLAPDVPLTPDLLKRSRELAYDVGYKPLADLPAINWSPVVDRAADALVPNSMGGMVKSPGHDQIVELVNSIKGRGQWTGEQLLNDIRQLRSNADDHFRLGQNDLARAEKGAAKLLEDLADDNVARVYQGSPDAVKLYREAREYIAKTKTVEKSLNPATGEIDARVWARRIRDGKPMSGEMEVAGRFAAAFPKASQAPSQIAGPGVSKLGATLATMFAGGGAMAGGLPGIAAGAAPLLIPPALRAQMLSRRAQRNVLRDMYDLPTTTRAGVNVLRVLPYSPAALGES